LRRDLTVLSPIQLHRQQTLLAEEVQDERPAGMLAPKLEPGEAPVAQLTPHGPLGVGALAAELSTVANARTHAAVSVMRGEGCGAGPSP
jgi:hypothetical protein